MKTFETRKKLRMQRDISARQHDRVSRDLEAAQDRIDELVKAVKDAIGDRTEQAAKYEKVRKAAWYWKNSHDEAGKQLAEARGARDQAVALAGEYATVLKDTYGWEPPEAAKPEQAADWTEAPADDEDRPDEHVEEFPSVFLEVAQAHKAEHPEVEGKTTSFYRLTPEQEAELQKDLPDVAAWDAFTTTVPVIPAKARPRRRATAARKPGPKS